MNVPANLIDLLRQRLQNGQPLPGPAAHALLFPNIVAQPRVPPPDARPSAVMALLFFKEGQLHLLLMQRTPDKGAHSSQISFPGGKWEKRDPDLKATALRETKEEIGIDAGEIEVLGALSPLYIPVSNFQLFPFLGFLEKAPAYFICEAEVHCVIEVPFSFLLDEKNRVEADVTSPVKPELVRRVHAWRLPQGEILWGATAMITAELVMVAAALERGPGL